MQAQFPAPTVLHLSRQGMATTQWCGAAKAPLRPQLSRALLQAAQHIEKAGRTWQLPASTQHWESSGTQMQVHGRQLHPVCTISPSKLFAAHCVWSWCLPASQLQWQVLAQAGDPMAAQCCS